MLDTRLLHLGLLAWLRRMLVKLVPDLLPGLHAFLGLEQRRRRSLFRIVQQFKLRSYLGQFLLPLLLLGVSTSLVPCAPLAAVLLLAAHKGSVLTGISYGLVFGSGLIVSPLMAASGGIALISSTIRQKVSWIGPYLQGTAMVILLFMGIRILLEV